MHEIISIQLGLESNYLATHFWNAQESYFPLNAGEESPVDSDVNFRRGIGPSGAETYNPRTLIYDIKDNFGSLRRGYDGSDGSSSNGALPQNATATTIITEPEIPHHSFQTARNWDPRRRIDNVRYWSDFRRVEFHPRSSLPVGGPEGLSDWRTGEDWWAAGEDVADGAFRWFAEECDLIQGVVIYAGMENAWGAFAAECAQRLRDEVGTLPIWVWTVGGSAPNVTKRHQASVVAIDRLADSASLLCPLTFFDGQPRPDYLRFACERPWEAAAVQAAAVETLSLPTRLHPGTRGALAMGQLEAASFTRDHALMRAEMSAGEGEGEGEPRGGGGGGGGDGHGDGGDSRMRDRSASPPGGRRPPTGPLDFPFLPSFPITGVRPKTFSTVEVLRGDHAHAEHLLPRAPGLAADPDGVVRTWLPTRLQFPRPNSYPAVFGGASTPPSGAGSFGVSVGASGGDGDGTDGGGGRAEAEDMAGGLRVRARLVADTGVAGWLRRFSLKARLLELSMREEVTDHLLELADRYVGGEYGVEEDDDDDDME